MSSRHLTRLILCLTLLFVTVLTSTPLGKTLAQTPKPTTVTIPGTIQSKLGCDKDWAPDCDKTALKYDDKADLWYATFKVPAGAYEYKVALNGSWTENYGLNAKKDGPNIPLKLDQDTDVTFIYDHKTHWVTDSVNTPIITLPGTLQSKLGCPGDWQPECLVTWMEDPAGKGVYTFTTKALPAGKYEVKVAINRSWTLNYGKDGAKDGANIPFTVFADNAEVYFEYDSSSHVLKVSSAGAPKGDLSMQQAYWVSRDTIIWKFDGMSPDLTYGLNYAAEGGLKPGTDSIGGGSSLKLTYSGTDIPKDVLDKFPFLSGAVLKLDAADIDKVPDLLKGQIAVSAVGKDGKLLNATGLQIPGVLDDLYTYNGDLGVTFKDGVPTIRVWAPTARSVGFNLFDDKGSTTTPMTVDPKTGVWSITGTKDWNGKYYLFEVEVYVPSTGKIEKNLVTDPYSFSLSIDSYRSQIVDLNDPSLMPPGWNDVKKPALASPDDIVIYELHVRDFSMSDQTVPENLRGTYKAFTVADSNGMKHLKALAQAGLTHVHLLPVFDIASIEEYANRRQEPDQKALAALPPDSDQQQALIQPQRDSDGFNWGYDPYHYTTPEGSYSTNPDGSTRLLEFREMVQALNQSGLRVIMDVVYNHTSAAGMDKKSVLDRIVPGYYYRLNGDGQIETSTCCQNTATEHAMMEKLMVDSIHTWATAYKIDGFRFDLMGHHMVSNIVNVRKMLDALTVSNDGVDGKAVYLYGEGWDFGEVAKNAHGKNATQINMAGTGVGTFNDRLRDGTRGGGPFNPVQQQGFITGLFTDPNKADNGDDPKGKLLMYEDWIKIGLAGNLKAYKLVNAKGQEVTGDQIDYNGSPAGYTDSPQENIVYISAHDNEVLFDAIQAKAPATATIEDRIRMQNLGNSIVMFSQGVPFFHAGDDILRSKSGDKNSYNSGDWFNRLDFSYQTNNWGVGLPPAGDNKDVWPVWQPLLADPKLKPTPDQIKGANAYFQELLQIRKSSPLFRLQTAADVEQRLKFYNVGPDSVPGMIVMAISDSGSTTLDSKYSMIVVIFNATPTAQTFTDPAFKDLKFMLHPVQAASSDPVTRTSAFSADKGFTVPGRTAAVFVVMR